MLLVGRDFETPGHGWRVEGLAARMRVPLQWLEPILDSLREAVLLAETGDGYLVPGRDPRRIMLAEIVTTIRDSDRDRAAAAADDWSRTINAVTAELDDALRGALGERSLASLVAAEGAAAADVEPSGATPPLEDGTRG
jgi:DNA-binding IscR family transcriptional regulator